MKILKNGRRRTAMLTSALALALIPFSAGTASANTTPGWGDDMPDVLWDCNNNNADSCQYHEQNAETELDERRQVSNVISNCASNRDLTVTRTVTDTRSTEYAFEQETSVEVSAGFSDTFEAGMKASDTQSETWKVGEAHTATETRTTTVPAGQQGAWWFAPYVRHSQGYLEVHYGERKHGHYIWYYRGPGGLPAIDVKTPVFLPTGELKGNFYWATWNC